MEIWNTILNFAKNIDTVYIYIYMYEMHYINKAVLPLELELSALVNIGSTSLVFSFSLDLMSFCAILSGIRRLPLTKNVKTVQREMELCGSVT